jgi:hypothetical protein
MAIEDQILNDEKPNSIDSIVRGGFKTPLFIPSMDYQEGMISSGNPTAAISKTRVSEAPLSDFQRGASAISAGLKAGEVGNGQHTYDETEAAVKIGSATISGAVAGGVAAGPAGAAVGAVAGALEASVNAWLSLRSSKRQRSQMKAIQQEARERQAKEDAMTAEEKAYNRSQASMAGAADSYFKTVGQLERLAANDSSLKELFVKRGF